MAEFYKKQELLSDRAAFVKELGNIQAQRDALDVRETELETNIEEIDSVLLYTEAGYPSVTQVAMPATFTATPGITTGTYQVNLAWASVADADGYIIQRALESNFSDAVDIHVASEAETSYLDNTGISPETVLYYRIKAQQTGKADSEWKTVSVFIPAQLDMVTNPTVTAAGSDQMTITFEAAFMATDYVIERNTTNDYNTATTAGTVAATSFTDGGLTADTQYYYWAVSTAPEKLASEPKYLGTATTEA